MKTRTIKGFFGALLCCLLLGALLPGTAMAAGVSVYVGNQLLSEGVNSYGEGTITLNSTDGTLTLENVDLTEGLQIYNSLTVIVKGTNRIEPTATYEMGIGCNGTLNLQIESDASLTMYATEANNIYAYGGDLILSGSGTLTADASGYPCLVASGNVDVDGLTLDLSSSRHGIYSENGDISINNSDVTIVAGGVGIFAQNFNSSTEEFIDSSVYLTNSTLDIIADGDSAVFCGEGELLADNIHLITYCSGKDETDEDGNPEPNGYTMYSEGDVIIKGANTVIDGDDGLGISAYGVLKIEDGSINVDSVDTALLGYSGVTITGGDVTAHSEINSAILGTNGPLTITGADTKVIATSDADDPTIATIRNARKGGLTLDAYIVANNTGGGKPFEGVMSDGSQAITLGEGYEAYPQCTLTTQQGHTYFVDNQGAPVTGRLDVCSHQWGTPVFTWAPDGSSCSVTLTCGVDDSHTLTLNSADQPDSIQSQVTTPATCTDMGTTTYTATLVLDQDHVYTDSLAVEVDPAGHQLTKTEAREATCTVDGNTAYWYCSVCDKYFSDEACTKEIAQADAVIPAPGHQLIQTEAREATCTVDGNTAYWRCSVCGRYFSDEACAEEITLADTLIPAPGHTPARVEPQSPTTEAVGNTGYWYCPDCGKYFSNQECTQEVALADTVIPKLPKIIAGAEQTWTRGGKDGLAVTSDAPFDGFRTVQVDGTDLDEANYEVKEGSTQVTLKPAYLETLSLGGHSLSIVSDTGTATTTFTIEAKAAANHTDTTDTSNTDSSPKTGDSSLVAVGVVSLVVACGGLLAILLWNRRKNRGK